MMFKKYVQKLTNTIGTVEYLKKKSSARAELLREQQLKRDKYSKADLEADYMPRSRNISGSSTDSAIISASSSSNSSSSGSASSSVVSDSDSEPMGNIRLNQNSENVLVFDTALLALPAAQIIISTAIAELRSAPELQPLVCKIYKLSTLIAVR